METASRMRHAADFAIPLRTLLPVRSLSRRPGDWFPYRLSTCLSPVKRGGSCPNPVFVFRVRLKTMGIRTVINLLSLHGETKAVAAYRMDVEGWAEADAEEEMRAFGFNNVWHQLKDFVRRYPAKPKR